MYRSARSVVYSIVVGLLLASPAAAQVDDPSTPQKNEAITSSGLAPYAYVRTTEHDQAGRFISSQIVPINGVITTLLIGSSGCQGWGLRIYSDLTNGRLKTVHAANHRFVRAAQSGWTTRRIADLNDARWPQAIQSAITYGGGVDAVQHVHACLNSDAPATYGETTQARLDAIFAVLRTHFPNLKLFTTNGLNWTGQSRSASAPNATIAREDALLALNANLHDGVWQEHFSIYSDGDHCNVYAASPLFPGGLCTFTEDTRDDGYHPATWAGVIPATGQVGDAKFAASLLDRWRNDPIFWFFWKDVQKPSGVSYVQPTPEYQALDGVLLKKLGAACSIIWGTQETVVPGPWCAEFGQ